MFNECFVLRNLKPVMQDCRIIGVVRKLGTFCLDDFDILKHPLFGCVVGGFKLWCKF